MSNTTSPRSLVLNASNEAQNPADHGLALAGMKEKGSPSFTDPALAGLFAAWLAKRNPGRSFYVATITGGAVGYNTLSLDDAKGAIEVKPITIG